MVRRLQLCHLPCLTFILSLRPPHPYDQARPRQRRAQASPYLHPGPSSNNRTCTRPEPICNAHLMGTHTAMCHCRSCLPTLPHLSQTLGSSKQHHIQLGAASFDIFVAPVQLVRYSKHRAEGHPRYRNRVPRSTFGLCGMARIYLDKSHFPSTHGAWRFTYGPKIIHATLAIALEGASGLLYVVSSHLY